MVRVPQMRHADFGAVGAIEGVLPGLYGEVQGSPALGHASVLDVVRQVRDHWTRPGADPAWRPVVRLPIVVEG